MQSDSLEGSFSLAVRGRVLDVEVAMCPSEGPRWQRNAGVLQTRDHSATLLCVTVPLRVY